MLKETIDWVLVWAPTTSLAKLMLMGKVWAIAESVHFIGLSLLIGAIGAFDLRLIGVGKDIPLRALHHLVPFAVLGYGLNLVTGIAFLSVSPSRYAYNPAFQLKILFMLLAGLNILFFYITMFRTVQTLGPRQHAPLPARVAGAVSLVAWLSVITCGRLLPFYREYHWCPWC